VGILFQSAGLLLDLIGVSIMADLLWLNDDMIDKIVQTLPSENPSLKK